MALAPVKRYWNKLAAMGCIVTGGPAEIAHCHGGSLIEHGRSMGRDYQKAKGKKLAHMDWLVLPICPDLHRIQPFALDHNVDEWEYRYGPQTYWLDVMIARTGIDVWALARSRHDLEPA